MIRREDVQAMDAELRNQVLDLLTEAGEAYARGYNAGVDAAHKAINALPASVTYYGTVPIIIHINVTDALAAIDALRGES